MVLELLELHVVLFGLVVLLLWVILVVLNLGFKMLDFFMHLVDGLDHMVFFFQQLLYPIFICLIMLKFSILVSELLLIMKFLL